MFLIVAPQQRKIKHIPHKGCVWSERVAIELEKKRTSYQIFLQLTGVDVRISGCTYQQYPTVRKTDSCECSFATFQKPNLGMLLWYPQSGKPVLNFVQHRYCICLVVKFPTPNIGWVSTSKWGTISEIHLGRHVYFKGESFGSSKIGGPKERILGTFPPPPRSHTQKKHAVWEKTLRERITKRIPKNINILKGH